MKPTLLLCLALLCGCDQNPKQHPEKNGSRFDSSIGAYCHMQRVEDHGHVFQILFAGQGGVAICEVTDASLVKTNAEKP